MPGLAKGDPQGNKDLLKKLIRERSFRFGSFILTSGKESAYYFDGKQVTLHPQGAYLVARAILEKVKDIQIQAIGGPTLGADPMVGSLATVLYLEGMDLKLFIVRGAAKTHGTKRFIEGPQLLTGDRVVIIDDVITSGGSIIRAIETVQEVGCNVVKVVTLVDRREGGTEKIEKMGIEIDPIFDIKDFI